MSEHEGDKPEENGAGEEDEVIFPEDEAGDEAEEPSDLEKARNERDRMREQLLRIAADFDNFRKRSRKEIEEVRRRAIEDTLREGLGGFHEDLVAAHGQLPYWMVSGRSSSTAWAGASATRPCCRLRPR